MKNIYTICSKVGLSLIFTLLIKVAFAQPTTLAAGDIAFTGYVGTSNSPDSDAFSFVLLKPMNVGTIIRFTDNAFGNDLVLKTNEQTLSLSLAANYAAGVEITVSGVPNSTPISAIVSGNGTTAGTATGTMLSLSVNGDQVIAYQSAVAGTPPFTFISALHVNVYNGGTDPSVTNATSWDNLPSATHTLFSCFIPTGLTNGTNAVWLGTEGVMSSEKNNARFNCNLAIMGGANLSTPAGIRAACNNKAYWNGEFAATGAPTLWPLPSNCNYAGVLLPVRLMNFQVENNINHVAAKWQVTNQIDVSHYEVERSFNATHFEKIGTVTAQSGTGNLQYSFTDYESLKANATIVYYRLKTVDLNGEYSYSNIINIRKSKNQHILVDNLINPIGDNLTFTITLNTSSKVNIKLADANGRIYSTKSIQLSAGRTNIHLSDVQNLAKGVYFLHISADLGTAVHKLIK